MPSAKRNDDGLLARVNFPLYTLQMLTNRHVIVGGGGGSSNTGVANGFEIYEISHDGNKFIAEEIVRHETGPCVVMNTSAFSNAKHSYLVAGQESHCQLYKIVNSFVQEEKVEVLNGDVRSRKQKNLKEADKNRNNKRLKFVIKPGDSIQTDFLEDSPLQRVVRVDKQGKLMATGGTDGLVRLWDFPGMKLKATFKGHSKEIDDIDFCPYSSSIVTVAKDGKALIWDSTTGKEKMKLHWDPPTDSKYLFKRCRFGRVEEEGNKSVVFTLSNPSGVAGKLKAYLQKWNPETGTILRAVGIDESLSALAVRDDGRFVALGTMFSGSVSIYIAFSLQRLHHVSGAHSMFVTGLEFLPVTDNNVTVTSVSEVAVLSISVDNRLCIHSLPYRKSIPAWMAIVIIIAALFGTFILCAYFDI